MYYLFLFIIAFRDEELAYPWTYAGILAVFQIAMAKFFGLPLGTALLNGGVEYLYVGFVFQWLSRQTRFSLFWWLAFAFALLPIVANYTIGARSGKAHLFY